MPTSLAIFRRRFTGRSTAMRSTVRMYDAHMLKLSEIVKGRKLRPLANSETVDSGVQKNHKRYKVANRCFQETGISTLLTRLMQKD